MTFITARPILPAAFLLATPPASCSALATFFGVVRNHHAGRTVRRLHYECYASMANCEIRRIKEEVVIRRELADIRILHRIGTLEIGEIAVAVAASSAHRAEALAACAEVVEEIKRSVPIWKKEFYEDGTSAWVGCAHAEAVS